MSFFLLNWKKVSLLLIFFLIVLLLNYIQTFLLETQDSTFFILALIIIPLYFMVAIIYSLVQIIRKKREGKSLNE